MKQFAKRSLAMLLALVLSIGLLAGLSFEANAVTDENQYVTGSTAQYSNVIANWGERGETATYLSPNAENFYEDNNVTYADLAALSGSFDLDNVTSSELYTALRNLMVSNHTEETTYGDTRYLYAYTDCQNSDITTLTCFYSGTTFSSTWDQGTTWNREHTWPKSKTVWNETHDELDNTDSGEAADLMTLRPVSIGLNSSRSNKAYGDSNGFYNPNTTGSSYDVRGDVARVVLYAYVRWDSAEYMWGSSGVMESLDVLLKWMEEDPVDTWELGRNDSVESVTGTRNVFVDYPELAFLLFNEEIPADMATPSGEGYNNDFTITATVNGNGNVSVNGNTITAIADDGYEVAGYTIISGEATVAQNGKYFTVSASSDCTIQINFEAKTAAMVIITENGELITTVDTYVGDTFVLPENENDAPDGHTFIGWVTATVSNTETAPENIYYVGDSYTVASKSVMFYALYTVTEGGGSGSITSYELWNGEIEDGYYLIVQDGGAMKAAISSSRFAYSSVTINNNTILNPDAALIWYIEETSDGYYTIYNESVKKYAASTGAKNKGALSGSVDNKAKWTITLNANGTFDIVNRHNKSNSVNANLRRNGTYGFATYAATGSNTYPPYLYKGVSGTVNYTTGAEFVCDHSGAVVVEEATATCVATGVKAHSHCDVCGAYFVDGAEVEYDSLIIEVNVANHAGDTYLVDEVTASCAVPGYSGDTYCAGCHTLLESGHEVTVDHTLESNEGKAATCIATGTKAHDYCTVCKQYFIDGRKVSETDVILPLDTENHEDVVLVGKADATCTATGYTGDDWCNACQSVVTPGTEIPMEAHELEKVEYKAATYEADGNIEHYICSECGTYFSDANGENEIEAESVIIPMLVRDPEDDTTEEEKPEDDTTEEEKPEDDTTEEEKPEDDTIEEEKPEDDTTEDENLKTGDSSHLLLAVALLLFAGCGAAVMGVIAVKRKY